MTEKAENHAITVLLQRSRDGDKASLDELMTAVYDDLKRIARGQLARWHHGQTINTTALVHESYLKLASNSDLDWQDRGHYFAVAARAMRFIIVDYARSRLSDKRRGVIADIELSTLPDDGQVQIEQVVAVDQLLGRLESLDEEMARIVECRFFAAYTLDETAAALNISRRSVQRKWQRARAWLATLGGLE
jgi:RNA polymerase sigma factor (TIGR02999 family)